MTSQPAQPVDTRPWAIYARLSKRQEFGLEKVEYQIELSQRFAQERGIPTDPNLIFSDNALSAWKKRVRRPGWERLMELANAGAFPGILIPRVDRFTRRLGEAEALLDLAEEHGMLLDGPQGGYDLRTREGRERFKYAAFGANQYSESMSWAAKDGLRRKMEGGKPMGAGRAWGFEVGGLEQRADEAETIREVAQRMLAGESTRAIVDDLNERGDRFPEGHGGDRRFSVGNLSRAMRRPRNGGFVEAPSAKGGRSYRVIGEMPGEPILDRATYDELQALLSSRRRGRPFSAQYPLTGIAMCERCDRPMNGYQFVDAKGRHRRYFCPRDREPKGCGRVISADGVEAMVDEYVTALLADPHAREAITEEEAALAGERAEATMALSVIEDRLVELEAKWAAGEIRQRAYDAAKPILDKQLAAAEERLGVLSAPVVGVEWDPAETWAQVAPERKRAALRDLGVRVTIGDYRPTQMFDRGRVTITP